MSDKLPSDTSRASEVVCVDYSEMSMLKYNCSVVITSGMYAKIINK